jgi:hypothetical protein
MAVFGKWKFNPRCRKASDFGKRLCPDEWVPASFEHGGWKTPWRTLESNARRAFYFFDKLTPFEKELVREGIEMESIISNLYDEGFSEKQRWVILQDYLPPEMKSASCQADASGDGKSGEGS